jgi:hypothetical protein
MLNFIKKVKKENKLLSNIFSIKADGDTCVIDFKSSIESIIHLMIDDYIDFDIKITTSKKNYIGFVHVKLDFSNFTTITPEKLKTISEHIIIDNYNLTCLFTISDINTPFDLSYFTMSKNNMYSFDDCDIHSLKNSFTDFGQMGGFQIKFTNPTIRDFNVSELIDNRVILNNVVFADFISISKNERLEFKNCKFKKFNVRMNPKINYENSLVEFNNCEFDEDFIDLSVFTEKIRNINFTDCKIKIVNNSNKSPNKVTFKNCNISEIDDNNTNRSSSQRMYISDCHSKIQLTNAKNMYVTNSLIEGYEKEYEFVELMKKIDDLSIRYKVFIINKNIFVQTSYGSSKKNTKYIGKCDIKNNHIIEDFSKFYGMVINTNLYEKDFISTVMSNTNYIKKLNYINSFDLPKKEGFTTTGTNKVIITNNTYIETSLHPNTIDKLKSDDVIEGVIFGETLNAMREQYGIEVYSLPIELENEIPSSYRRIEADVIGNDNNFFNSAYEVMIYAVDVSDSSKKLYKQINDGVEFGTCYIMYYPQFNKGGYITILVGSVR